METPLYTMSAGPLNPEPKDPYVTLCKYAVPIKYLSLLCLVVQNSSLVLTMRYSRTTEGPMFLSSTAVVLSELLKMCCAFFLVFYEDRFHWPQIKARFQREVFDIPMDMVKLAVPSILYTIQNNLQYVAVSHLDAATFQVTYQLKILTTAIFSVAMLGKSLDRTKWFSLFVLTFGVALVQLPPGTFSSSAEKASVELAANGTEPAVSNQNPYIGLMAVLAACVLSGFAGVYFEKILKGSPVSLWIRNIQLGFYGTIIGLCVVHFQDGAFVAEHGYFYGYQAITFVVIANQAMGGLLVAVVVKYADNILKGYATSISIIISCLFSVFFFGFEITLVFLVGSGFVMWAVFLYS